MTQLVTVRSARGVDALSAAERVRRVVTSVSGVAFARVRGLGSAWIASASVWLALGSVAIAVGGLSSVGCKSDKALDPTQGLPKATIAEPRTEPSVGSAAYEFGPKDSSIQFVGSNLAGTQEGKFTAFSGAIAAPDGDPTHATVSLSVEVGSIQTAVPDLTKHLLSADFLDAVKYPTLKFTSTAISPDKQGYLIEGVLEMHGVKKQITFPAELTLPPNPPAAKAQFTLNRQAFGVAFKGAPDNLIRDDVVVRLDIKTQAKP